MNTTDGNVIATILSEREEESDSDKELQIAFDEGLLKTDELNYVVEKKRPIINKKIELKDKGEKLKKNLTWLETLDVTVNNDHVDEKILNHDFEREIIFYKQAEKAVRITFPRLHEMGVRISRPTDYFAEMVKSDQHMQKIRQRMAEVEESKQKLEAIRRIREQKKFAAKVQKKVMEQKQNEKKVLVDAVKKHQKGMKSHLDIILNNAKRIQDIKEERDSRIGINENGMKRSERERTRGKRTKKFRRIARDKKFGFGGQKKRSKKNDKNSFEEITTPGSLVRKLKGHHFGAHLLKPCAKRRKR
ncbi:putative rRNA-processing protein [Dirofilaria immitis]